MQIEGAGGGERPNGQGRLVEVGHHAAEGELEPLLDRPLQRHALGGRALDEDVHAAGALRQRDQAVDLDPRHAEPLRDLLLGIATHEGEPRGARRQPELDVRQEPLSLIRALSRTRRTFAHVTNKRTLSWTLEAVKRVGMERAARTGQPLDAGPALNWP